MAYKALYRKWRPDTFDKLIGQEAVKKTLKNQVMSGRIGHAYLFCGTRGTGKTSAAKILARAANCPNASKTGSPCNTCASCLSILDGSSMNVIEIDAASNNGVDNIRDIREEVEYPPVSGRYRVYIIDEVHMLSAGAFNALLKTLEEPPSYVIFILATTDPQKVPATILSRCQRYDFRRISRSAIFGQLQAITAGEGLSIEEKALQFIAEAGDGSMRDALSILEQCLSFAEDRELTYDDVLGILGAADTGVYSKLLSEISRSDVSSALMTVSELIETGADIMQIMSGFIWYMRNVLLSGSIRKGSEDLLDISAETFERASADAAVTDRGLLIKLLGSMAELMNRSRFSSQKRVMFEVEIIRLCCMRDTGSTTEDRTPSQESAPGEALRRKISAGNADSGNAKGRGSISSGQSSAAGREPLPWEDCRSSEKTEYSVPDAKASDAHVTGKAPVNGTGRDSVQNSPKDYGKTYVSGSAAADRVSSMREAESGSDDLSIIRNSWDELVGKLHPSNRPLFAGASLVEEKGVPVILFKSSMNYKLAAGNIEENGVLKLRELAAGLTGHDIKLMARPQRPGEILQDKARITDEELAGINFHIDIED